MTTALIAAIAIALQVTAWVFLFRAVKTARTSQGAVGWAVFLTFAPHLAVPIYLFLGKWRYSGYEISRRDSAEVIGGLKLLASAAGVSADEETELGRAMSGIAEMPVTRGNGFRLLYKGREVFDQMFQHIAQAEHYVLVQFYIIRDDGVGNELKESLLNAARRGVKVRLLYDAIGSKDLDYSYIADLQKAGVDVADINRLLSFRSRFQVNFRNHRKSLIIDGRIGFTGGYNIGDEYAGLSPRFGNWRDTHCILRGPMVSQLQLVYAEDWHSATKVQITDNLNWHSGLDEADMRGLIVPTGPADQLDTGALYFCSAIHAAQKRLWIASPYLVIENDILAALNLAVLRGVDVRILIPAVRDHWSTWLAAFAFFDELQDAGIKVYLYQTDFMHQKVMLIDDQAVAVGTTNLDNRSCRLNFEAAAVMLDTQAAADVAAMLTEDFAHAVQETQRMKDRSLFIRYGAPIARLFAPVL